MISNAHKIERFDSGDRSTPLSSKRANELVDVLNALLNIRIARSSSDHVEYSEGGILICLKHETLNEPSS